MGWCSMLLNTLVAIVMVAKSEKIEIRRLHDLSLEEYENIFAANYADSHGKLVHHDIHLVDELGKFIKLSYQSQHPLNTEIIKLDDTEHSEQIQSLSCSTVHDEDRSIKLTFKSPQMATQYYNDITSTLSNEPQRHFISGSLKWGCINPETNIFEGILREITAIHRASKTELTLFTQTAGLLDVFEELSIVYESNSNHNVYKSDSLIQKYMHHMDHHSSPTPKRRLSENDNSLWRSMWPSMKMGLFDSMNFFKDLVSEVGVFGLTKAAMGYEVDFGPKTARSTWSWNYNDLTRSASSEILIAENATCTNCFVHLDLSWRVEAVVRRRKLQSLSFTTEGDMQAHLEIIKKGNYNVDKELAFKTDQLIPDISFSVAGVHFDLSIWGDVGVAVRSRLNYAFSVGIGTSGYIKKGIAYNGEGWLGSYEYINEDHLDYDIDGPKIGFETGEMSNFMYIRPLLYMRMTHLVDVYFGIQPTFELYITNHEYQTCAVHYAPFLNLNQFIGAGLAMMKWPKELDFGLYQSNIDNLGGCLSKADLVRHSILLSDVLMDDDGDIFYDAYDEFDDAYGRRRRRLFDEKNHVDPVHYVDFSNVDLFPAFSVDGVLSQRLSFNWWGNLSTVDNICNHWDSSCFEHQNKPRQEGSLMISLSEMDNASGAVLIGVYRTKTQVNGHILANTSMVTNVSCTARHRFDLTQNKFDNDGIRVYDVRLLEWYCDMNISDIGMDEPSWECMIRLPSQMKAISLDASFGSIVLFDARSWCYVFVLTTKPIYELNASLIDWDTASYPSALWYGVWDCEEVFNEAALESRLYFISFDYGSGETKAILYLNANSSFRMHGHMDLMNMEMELVSVYWIEEQVYLNGSYEMYHFVGNLDILKDGTVIYAGSIQSSGCTGFLFQGFLNLTEFERSMYVMGGDEALFTTSASEAEIGNELMNNSYNTSLMIVAIGLGGLATASIVFSCVLVCHWIRNKKIEGKKYQLMNDDQL
eukprot:272369_1